jgi:hypothetical protein
VECAPGHVFYLKEVYVAKRRYVEVLTRLRTAKFKTLKPVNRNNLIENMETMRNNLWSMFHLSYSPAELQKFHETGKFPFGSNCADYAWTETVRNKFYSHECHIGLYKYLKKIKGMTWGMWSLQVEPADISDEEAEAFNNKRRNR